MVGGRMARALAGTLALAVLLATMLAGYATVGGANMAGSGRR